MVPSVESSSANLAVGATTPDPSTVAVIVTGSAYMLGFGEGPTEVVIEAPSEWPIVEGNTIGASSGIRKSPTTTWAT